VSTDEKIASAIESFAYNSRKLNAEYNNANSKK